MFYLSIARIVRMGKSIQMMLIAVVGANLLVISVFWVATPYRVKSLQGQICFYPGSLYLELNPDPQLWDLSSSEEFSKSYNKIASQLRTSLLESEVPVREVNAGPSRLWHYTFNDSINSAQLSAEVQVPAGAEVEIGRRILEKLPRMVRRFRPSFAWGTNSGQFANYFCDVMSQGLELRLNYLQWSLFDFLFWIQDGEGLDGRHRFEVKQLEGTDFLTLFGNRSSRH